RCQPRLLRPDDERAEKRDDKPAWIPGGSALTEVLVVLDPTLLVRFTLLQRCGRGGRQLRRDAAWSGSEEVAAAARLPEAGPVGKLREGRHLASTARRRHFQRRVELGCRAIFGPHREHPLEFVRGLTIRLRKGGRGRRNREQAEQSEP